MLEGKDGEEKGRDGVMDFTRGPSKSERIDHGRPERGGRERGVFLLNGFRV